MSSSKKPHARSQLALLRDLRQRLPPDTMVLLGKIPTTQASIDNAVESAERSVAFFKKEQKAGRL